MPDEIILRVISCKRSGKASGVILNLPMGNPATNPPKYGKGRRDLFDIVFERKGQRRTLYEYESHRYYEPSEMQKVREPSFLGRFRSEKLTDQRTKKSVRFVFLN